MKESLVLCVGFVLTASFAPLAREVVSRNQEPAQDPARARAPELRRESMWTKLVESPDLGHGLHANGKLLVCPRFATVDAFDAFAPGTVVRPLSYLVSIEDDDFSAVARFDGLRFVRADDSTPLGGSMTIDPPKSPKLAEGRELFAEFEFAPHEGKTWFDVRTEADVAVKILVGEREKHHMENPVPMAPHKQ